jgi:hypothetical protein
MSPFMQSLLSEQELAAAVVVELLQAGAANPAANAIPTSHPHGAPLLCNRCRILALGRFSIPLRVMLRERWALRGGRR